MKGPWLTTYRQHIISWGLFVKNVSTSLGSPQRPYVIMAEAVGSTKEVMLKRKMGAPMKYLHWTNQPQPSPPAKTLSAQVAANATASR